ncbi:MAG: hypothetical protein ABIG61_14490 [Planctomycetota bacterium]
MSETGWDKLFIEDEAEIESQGKAPLPKTVLSAYFNHIKNETVVAIQTK